MTMQTFEEYIKRLRSQILIHSYIYYKLGSSIISDHMWDGLAIALRDLQAQGEHPMIGWYDEEFKGWDGTSGYDLPQDEWVAEKALYIMRLHVKFTGD